MAPVGLEGPLLRWASPVPAELCLTGTVGGSYGSCPHASALRGRDVPGAGVLSGPIKSCSLRLIGLGNDTVSLPLGHASH